MINHPFIYDCLNRKAEESDQQRLICTIDKYPKVSFEDVKKKMVVVEGSKVNYTIERSVSALT